MIDGVQEKFELNLNNNGLLSLALGGEILIRLMFVYLPDSCGGLRICILAR
jgi:hypothetical protein